MAEEVIDTYDVLIAGGGALGATYAHYLAPHLKVLICEAGAQLSQKPGEHLKNSYLYQKDINPFSNVITGHLQQISIPLDGSYLDTLSPSSFNPGPFLLNGQNADQRPEDNLRAAFSTYAVGGMITHWTCAIPRHHPVLEQKVNGEDYVDPSEWEVLYQNAEALLRKDTTLYLQSVRNTVVHDALKHAYKDKLPANYDIQPLPMAGKLDKSEHETSEGIPWRRIRWTGADNIYGDLGDPTKTPKEKFQILAEHVVKKFHYAPVSSSDGEIKYQITHATVRDLGTGKIKIVKARYYVAACNSILTPQLLWHSGIGRNADKIAENQGKVTEPANLPVGRYLCEQPMAFCQVVLHKFLVERAAALVPERYPHWNPHAHDDPTGLPINEPPPNLWIPCSTGPYKYLNEETGERTIERQWHCQVHRDAFSYGAIPPNIDERVVVDLRWFGSNRPTFSNWVEFRTKDHNGSHSSDRLGMPQPTFHYKIPTEDVPAMHAMMTDMTYAASALGGYFPNTEPKWMTPGLALHFQGTVRVGKHNDGTTVANTNSRVWLFSNLYVAGNGIIPTATSSNPTLTSCGLAFKACKSILHQEGFEIVDVTKPQHFVKG